MRLKTAVASMPLWISALALLLGGCQQDTLKVGAALPLTGNAQIYGEAIHKGVTLAFEELKADTTYPLGLELEVADTGSDPAKGKELLGDLYGNGSVAVIGGVTTAEAQQMVEVADRYDRLLLSPSASSPVFSGISRNFYRIFPSDFLEANKMADFAARQLKVESIVIIAEEQEYAKSIQEVLQQQFKHFGVEILETIEYPHNTTDYDALVERAVTLQPSAVYLAAYAEAISAMVKALRAAGYKGRILTTSAFAVPSAIADAGTDAVGVLLTQSVFEVDSEHAHVQKFVKAFEAKHGTAPDLFAAYGYDAMKVLAEAIKTVGAVPSEALTGMRKIKDFPGVVGSIQFDERGDVKRYPRVYTISEDLTLNNYDAHIQRQRDEILKRMEAIKNKAKKMSSSG